MPPRSFPRSSLSHQTGESGLEERLTSVSRLLPRTSDCRLPQLATRRGTVVTSSRPTLCHTRICARHPKSKCPRQTTIQHPSAPFFSDQRNARIQTPALSELIFKNSHQPERAHDILFR